MDGRSSSDEKSADNFVFGSGRDRGIGVIPIFIHQIENSFILTSPLAGDPISTTQLHHPRKKHFSATSDEPDYDSSRPYMNLTKVKLKLNHYRELDAALVRDIEFIVNVPILSHTGDLIPVPIGGKVINVECPRLARRQNRFIVCFVA